MAGIGLKIVGLVASLDFIELITRVMPRVVGEVSQEFQRIAKEAHGPHSSLYPTGYKKGLSAVAFCHRACHFSSIWLWSYGSSGIASLSFAGCGGRRLRARPEFPGRTVSAAASGAPGCGGIRLCRCVLHQYSHAGSLRRERLLDVVGMDQLLLRVGARLRRLRDRSARGSQAPSRC